MNKHDRLRQKKEKRRRDPAGAMIIRLDEKLVQPSVPAVQTQEA